MDESYAATEEDAVLSMIGIPDYHTGRNLVDGYDGGRRRLDGPVVSGCVTACRCFIDLSMMP